MSASLQLHPLSALVGLGLGAVCLVSMSLTVVPTPLRVEYLAHPREMVTIRGATPYVVPAGKVFVLTGLGTTSPTAWGTAFKVNGVQEVQAVALAPSPGLNYVTVGAVPPGFTVAAGSTIEVCETNGQPSACLEITPRAWGYLAPQ